MAQFQISWVRELQTWLNDLPIFYKTILDNFKAPIPKHLLSIAKESDTFNKNFFTSNDNTFQLNDSVQINFEKARSRDFYKLFTSKTHTQDQTGPKRWSENLSLTKDSWSKIFKSLKNVCKDTKLKEFQFKLIH